MCACAIGCQAAPCPASPRYAVLHACGLTGTHALGLTQCVIHCLLALTPAPHLRRHQLQQIARVLRDTDPSLFAKLQQLGAEDCMFAYRWVQVGRVMWGWAGAPVLGAAAALGPGHVKSSGCIACATLILPGSRPHTLLSMDRTNTGSCCPCAGWWWSCCGVSCHPRPAAPCGRCSGRTRRQTQRQQLRLGRGLRAAAPAAAAAAGAVQQSTSWLATAAASRQMAPVPAMPRHQQACGLQCRASPMQQLLYVAARRRRSRRRAPVAGGSWAAAAAAAASSWRRQRRPQSL